MRAPGTGGRTAYVTNVRSSSVTAIDTTAGTVAATIPVGSHAAAFSLPV
jgi:YVTN family beta-propeller protein